MTFGLPIRHGRTLPFLRKPHKILKIVLWVTPKNSATSWAGFLIPKTSQMIRHRKSVLQGEGIFQTKKQIQKACSFQSETKNPTERKFLIKTRFFHMLDNDKWKMHTGARAGKQKYISIYGCVRFGNLDLDLKIRISDFQSNAKSENGFQRWDICFWIFIFSVRLGNPKKDLKNCP